jgi:hypothetical protein
LLQLFGELLIVANARSKLVLRKVDGIELLVVVFAINVSYYFQVL